MEKESFNMWLLGILFWCIIIVLFISMLQTANEKLNLLKQMEQEEIQKIMDCRHNENEKCFDLARFNEAGQLTNSDSVELCHIKVTDKCD